MPVLKSILVVGATGRFGTDVTHALAAEKGTSFDRVAVFNDTSRPASPEKESTLLRFRSAGVEIVDGHGYTSPSPFRGFDCVVMTLGNHALAHQPAVIDAAIAAGVRHFYPSEFGADLLVGDNWTQRYYRDKVRTRQHLERRVRQQDTPDLGWTYLTVGRFTEWAVLDHFGVHNRTHTAEIYGSSEGRQSLLGTADAVAYLVETLKEPLPPYVVGADAVVDGTTTTTTTAKGRRRTYRISGTSPIWSEIFDTLERVTGRAYDVTYLDVGSAKEEERQAVARGDVDAELAASHKLVQGTEGTLLPRPWDNERFPSIEPEGVESVLRRAFASPKYRRFYGLE